MILSDVNFDDSETLDKLGCVFDRFDKLSEDQNRPHYVLIFVVVALTVLCPLWCAYI